MGVIPHDLYVIGTQESSLTEKDWVNCLKAQLRLSMSIDPEIVCLFLNLFIGYLLELNGSKNSDFFFNQYFEIFIYQIIMKSLCINHHQIYFLVSLVYSHN